MVKATHKYHLLVFLILFFMLGCRINKTNDQVFYADTPQKTKPSIFTQYSHLKTKYSNFDSQMAINAIASIENEYFNSFYDSISRFYGSEWALSAKSHYKYGDSTVFDHYISRLAKAGLEPDCLHCTIYTVKALKVGMGEKFDSLEYLHKKIWDNREYAGWSIGYILTEYFGWKAYLFIDKESEEFERCQKNFNEHKKYYVWKQPDIKIEDMYIKRKQDAQIDSLLTQNEFGWGFSNQGIHSWFTRFTELKECIWVGSPGADYIGYQLFESTKFRNYHAYGSHIVIFPPTVKQKNS